jgi:hypothetical protein
VIRLRNTFWRSHVKPDRSYQTLSQFQEWRKNIFPLVFMGIFLKNGCLGPWKGTSGEMTGLGNEQRGRPVRNLELVEVMGIE